MAYSIKFVHIKNTVYARVTIDRKSAYLSTGVKLKYTEWDKKNNLPKKQLTNYANIRDRIFSLHSEIERRIIDLQSQNLHVSAKYIIDNIRPKYFLFTTIAQEHLEFTKKDKSIATYLKYQNHFDTIQADRLITKDTNVNEINNDFVKRYINAQISKGNAPSTIRKKIKWLKLVLNFAVTQSYIQVNPIRDFEYKDSSTTEKCVFSSEEIIYLESVSFSLPPQQKYSLFVFLFQFYCHGSRISDVLFLRRENITDEYIHFSMQKTDKRMKIVRNDRINYILSELPPPESVYIFPFITWRENPKLSQKENDHNKLMELKSKTAAVNMNLGRIAKRLEIPHFSSHSARHSFANYADRKLGGDVRMVQNLLGHSSSRTTEIYLHSLNQEKIDEAARKLF